MQISLIHRMSRRLNKTCFKGAKPCLARVWKNVETLLHIRSKLPTLGSGKIVTGTASGEYAMLGICGRSSSKTAANFTSLLLLPTFLSVTSPADFSCQVFEYWLTCQLLLIFPTVTSPANLFYQLFSVLGSCKTSCLALPAVLCFTGKSPLTGTPI